jgi:uncharacterized protein
MKLEQSFEVAAPVERVWKALIDVQHVAPCLPGAAVTGRNDDGSYSGSFKVKIGPTTASYTGKLQMQEVDESAHSATMHAQGSDKRGQGGATATIFSTLSPADGDGTRVEVITDYHITGRLARFGRGGMIEDISQRLLRQFAARLQDSLVHSPDATPEATGEAPKPAEDPMDAEVASGDEPMPLDAQTEIEEPAPISEVAPTTNRGEPAAPGAAPAPPAATRPPPPPPRAALPPPLPAAATPRRPQPAEPIQGVSLVSSVMWDRIRNAPAPLAFAAGVLLAVLVGLRVRT